MGPKHSKETHKRDKNTDTVIIEDNESQSFRDTFNSKVDQHPIVEEFKDSEIDHHFQVIVDKESVLFDEDERMFTREQKIT